MKARRPFQEEADDLEDVKDARSPAQHLKNDERSQPPSQSKLKEKPKSRPGPKPGAKSAFSFFYPVFSKKYYAAERERREDNGEEDLVSVWVRVVQVRVVHGWVVQGSGLCR